MRQTEKNVSPMSNEGRNTYVTTHITEALLALWAEKSLEEIAINELCEKAGVGRASFYRNFDTKEAVIRGYLHQIFQEYLESNRDLSTHPLSEQLGILFTHFESHQSFYKILSKRQMLYLLENEILDACGPKLEESMLEAYSKAFAAYSIYGWVKVWFDRGMQESAEDISALFRQYGL